MHAGIELLAAVDAAFQGRRFVGSGLHVSASLIEAASI
jgi:hypothetical protein